MEEHFYSLYFLLKIFSKTVKIPLKVGKIYEVEIDW